MKSAHAGMYEKEGGKEGKKKRGKNEKEWDKDRERGGKWESERKREGEEEKDGERERE